MCQDCFFSKLNKNFLEYELIIEYLDYRTKDLRVVCDCLEDVHFKHEKDLPIDLDMLYKVSLLDEMLEWILFNDILIDGFQEELKIFDEKYDQFLIGRSITTKKNELYLEYSEFAISEFRNEPLIENIYELYKENIVDCIADHITVYRRCPYFILYLFQKEYYVRETIIHPLLSIQDFETLDLLMKKSFFKNLLTHCLWIDNRYQKQQERIGMSSSEIIKLFFPNRSEKSMISIKMTPFKYKDPSKVLSWVSRTNPRLMEYYDIRDVIKYDNLKIFCLLVRLQRSGFFLKKDLEKAVFFGAASILNFLVFQRHFPLSEKIQLLLKQHPM